MNTDSNSELKNFLEQSYSKQMNDSEVFEYKDRFVKFVSILVEIDQKNKKKKS